LKRWRMYTGKTKHQPCIQKKCLNQICIQEEWNISYLYREDITHVYREKPQPGFNVNPTSTQEKGATSAMYTGEAAALASDLYRENIPHVYREIRSLTYKEINTTPGSRR
jgi:hypothetical protein